jgi:exodeoxyribonuclease VII large subunit
LKEGALHTLMNRLILSASNQINQERNNLLLINQEQLQQSKRIISVREELLKKQLEMLHLLIDYIISTKRVYLTNSLIVISSNSPKVILKKGFTISRVNGNLYNGEPLSKDTIIQLEFKDSSILTKYIRIEK